MGENIKIREMAVEDADAISKIYAAIIQKPAEDEFLQLIKDHARRDKDACFVAELGGRVVGFLISYILTMGFGITKSAWIATLGVDPQHMGQGLGEMMARETFRYYRSIGIKNVYTSVRWDSTDLLSFFKTLGFDRSNFVNLRKELE
jgi:ribosomal protein S18 acetylase RimI-like enzyme